ncbi:MAG: YkvA family protein [Dongiaceae bacterium]
MSYHPDKLQRDRARVEQDFRTKLRRNLRRIPFLEQALAAYYCAVDSRTPLQVKAVLFGALAYFVLPIDLLPDFIAVLGFTDDATVLYAAIRTVMPHIKDDHRARARTTLDRLSADPSAMNQSV